jgi:hypothetical protein
VYKRKRIALFYPDYRNYPLNVRETTRIPQKIKEAERRAVEWLV